MTTLSRTSLLAAATLLAACSSDHLIGYSPPDARRITCATLGVRCGIVDDGDGGTLDCGACANDAGLPFIPLSMGDEFAVDKPVEGPDEAKYPGVAFDGQVHLVAWMNIRGVFAARFDRDGKRLDGEPITVAPAAMVLGPEATVGVLPKEGGGFFVLWAGIGVNDDDNTPDPNRPTGLWSVTVGSDGQPSKPLCISTRYGFTDGYSIPSFFTVQATSTAGGGSEMFTMVGRYDDSRTFDSLFILTYGCETHGCNGIVPMGGTVSAFSHVRVGDRDFVAAIVSDPNEPTGSAVVVKVLPVGWAETLGTIGNAVEVLHANARSLGWGEPGVRVVAVGDRAAVIWESDSSDAASLNIATFRPTGPDSVESSQVVTFASGVRGVYGVAAGIEGSNVIAAVRGFVSTCYSSTCPVTLPLAIVLNPETLAQVATLDGDASVIPNDDGYRSAINAFSWNGEKNLAIVTQTNAYALGGGNSYLAAAVSADSTQPFSPLKNEQYLPGGENAQTSPRASCGREQCLIIWQDSRKSFAAYGIRANSITGEVLDPDSFLLSNHCDAVTATEQGFLCASVSQTPSFEGQLSVQVIPKAGMPSKPALYPMEQWWLRDFRDLQFAFAKTSSGLFLAAMLRHAVSPHTGDCRAFLFQIDEDGTAHPVSHSIPDGPYGTLAAIGMGGKVLIAFSEFSLKGVNFTTALVAPASSTTGAIKSDLASEWPVVGPFLVESAIGPVLCWLEHHYSDYSFRWATIDAGGIVGTPQTLLTERGEVGDVQVGFDGRGAAILYARRTFSTDPYEIVLRRFDPSHPAPQGPDDVRVVATDIWTPGHAFTGAGDGRWLAAYARYGIDWKYPPYAPAGTAATRVFGRFIYESSSSR